MGQLVGSQRPSVQLPRVGAQHLFASLRGWQLSPVSESGDFENEIGGGVEDLEQSLPHLGLPCPSFPPPAWAAPGAL